MLSTRLKTMAHPKELIFNPEDILLTHQMINPSITHKKRPKVTMVMGIVRKIRIGSIKKFKRVSIIAAGSAEAKLSISAPGKTFAVTHMDAIKTKNVSK